MLWQWMHFSVGITAFVALHCTNDEAILSQGNETSRGRESVTFLSDTCPSGCPEGSSSQAPCRGSVLEVGARQMQSRPGGGQQ